MKVVISCPNSKYVHASLSPWCLLSGIREFSKKTYDVSVLESTINGDMESFAHKIINENPNVVAFSCYIWNITKTLEVIIPVSLMSIKLLWRRRKKNIKDFYMCVFLNLVFTVKDFHKNRIITRIYSMKKATFPFIL